MKQLTLFDLFDEVQNQFCTEKASNSENQSNISPNISADNYSILCQWNTIKKQYPDAILLFRTGDLYMIYNKDAVTCAPILHLPICNNRLVHISFPFTDLDTNLPLLVRAGHRVAICEQIENLKKYKHIKQTILK